jgi:hypothetical protein
MKNNQQKLKITKTDWFLLLMFIGLNILYAYVDGQSIL